MSITNIEAKILNSIITIANSMAIIKKENTIQHMAIRHIKSVDNPPLVKILIFAICSSIPFLVSGFEMIFIPIFKISVGVVKFFISKFAPAAINPHC